MGLLRGEAARGVAVAITLHDLSLASRFCDEIVVLKDGHVVGQGVPTDTLSDAALAEVFGIAAKRLDGNVMPWSRKLRSRAAQRSANSSLLRIRSVSCSAE